LTAAERTQRLGAGASYALRLDVGRAARLVGALDFTELGAGPAGEHGVIAVDPWSFGDVVLARKDLPAAYHLAVVVDDAYQQVTRVTRGHDLFSATHIQRLLQALLTLPAPQYAHHHLILDASGRKLSKRDQAVTLRSLREQGVSGAQVRERLGLQAATSATRAARSDP
jgi:glutamyl-Q tRNA(Asp) synthetase